MSWNASGGVVGATFSRRSPPHFAAIEWCGLARIAQDRGKNGTAELRQSYDQYPFDRVIDALELDDPKMNIAQACKATGSPFVVAVDRRSIVRGEHVRGGLAIWNAIAEAALAETFVLRGPF
jgi:hypothetical protein